MNEKKKKAEKKTDEEDVENNENTKKTLKIISDLEYDNSITERLEETILSIKRKRGEPIFADFINGMLLMVFQISQQDFQRQFENYCDRCNGIFIDQEEQFQISDEERQKILQVPNYGQAGLILFLNYTLTEKHQRLQSLSQSYADNILTALKHIKGKLHYEEVKSTGIHSLAKEKFASALRARLAEHVNIGPGMNAKLQEEIYVMRKQQVRVTLEYGNESIHSEDHLFGLVRERPLSDFKLNLTTYLFVLFNRFIHQELSVIRNRKNSKEPQFL